MEQIITTNHRFETNLALFNELINPGFILHGHICPAMPLGIRASIEAMARLGVERALNKELSVIIENGPSHAALCFADGVQIGTGATFGKGEITRTNEGKNAFTLFDKASNRAIRVSIRYDFFEKMMNSPFVQKRKQGIEPYQIDTNMPVTMIQNMLNKPADEIFEFSDIGQVIKKSPKGNFNYSQCQVCKEPVYESGIRIRGDRHVCMSCYEQQN